MCRRYRLDGSSDCSVASKVVLQICTTVFLGCRRRCVGAGGANVNARTFEKGKTIPGGGKFLVLLPLTGPASKGSGSEERAHASVHVSGQIESRVPCPKFSPRAEEQISGWKQEQSQRHVIRFASAER